VPDVQNALFDSAAGGAHVDSELEHDDRRVEGKGAGGWDFVENYTVAVQGQAAGIRSFCTTGTTTFTGYDRDRNEKISFCILQTRVVS